MKFIFQTLLFAIALLNIAAAQQSTITGIVKNSEGAPIHNASIFLVTDPNRGIIKSAISNEKGEYVFIGFPIGNFRVEVTAVGYMKGESNLFTTKESSIVLPEIVLANLTKEIETVHVQAQLPQIKHSNGKLVMNVENSTISAGNDAFEVLKRAPGVYVDKDDNITLMGQQGINVTIDGRQTYLSGDQLVALLKSMSGDQIKQIELSIVRSAKDDAEGGGGVINITLKKNRIEGFNGTYIASAGFGKRFRGNTSVSLNYKRDNTTLFGNYGYTDNTSFENITLLRVIPDKMSQTTFDQLSDMIERNKIHTYKVGIEQKTSKRNVLLFQFNGSNTNSDEDNFSNTKMGETFSVVDSILDSYTTVRGGFDRYSFNINNEFKIDTIGRKLTADLDYSLFNRNGNTGYDYHTMFPDNTYMYPIEYERSFIDRSITIFSSKLDYEQPLWKGHLEAGVKYSNVNTDNNIAFDLLRDSNWNEDLLRTNSFDYTEQIYAGYIDYSREFQKIGIKAGLRGEYTNSDGFSKTMNKQVKLDYFNLFPSASVSYSFNDNHVLAFSYSRKISRPNYNNLNPFEEYVDKRTYNKGNPFLKPEYKDGFLLNYTLMKAYNIALGYDYSNDAIVESLGQDSILKTTWITKENLGTQQTSYINLTIPVRVGKIFSMYNNITGIYIHFKGPIAGYYVNQGAAFVQGNSTSMFKISNSFSAEATIKGSTRFIYNLYEIKERIGADLGFTYNLKDKKSNLKFAVTDVFHTDHNNVFTHFKEFDSKIYQYNDRQSFRLTFTHKFGNLKQSIRRVNNDSDEKDRAL